MENKMPLFGKINCRNLWKIVYHSQQVGRYYKRGTLYDKYTRYDRLENNSPSFWWRAWKKRWKDTAADQYYALELKEYYRDMDSQGSD